MQVAEQTYVDLEKTWGQSATHGQVRFLILETSLILSVIAGYNTRNDLYEHLSEEVTHGQGRCVILETSSVLSVIAEYNTRNDLYDHLLEEVITTNRSEQLTPREGVLFWRPLWFSVL